MHAVETIEQDRLNLQHELDSQKSQAERNKLGQFATGTSLSDEILKYAKYMISAETKINFLDPAFGTGSFFSSLLRQFPESQLNSAVGYEIDPHYGEKTIRLWSDTLLKLYIEDFTRATPPLQAQNKVNLLICNPPYVRHHHIPPKDKLRLNSLVKKYTNINMNGLAGFYCYYLCLSHPWMANNCLACWLIPSEFMDVKYGNELKKYLIENVTLIHIHRFNPMDLQFKDALVSSSIIWFRNEKPVNNYQVKFSYGGSLLNPNEVKYIPIDVLKNSKKWNGLLADTNHRMDNSIIKNQNTLKLSDLFIIKRGIATGDNDFFILTQEEINKYDIPNKFLIPILPSPRYLKVNKVDHEAYKDDKIVRLFLLSCNSPEQAIKDRYPKLWNYYQEGIKKGANKRYLCKNRVPWYSQENRPIPMYLCTYMGRNNLKTGKNFRFILNNSNSIATNSYLLLYPKYPLNNFLLHDLGLREAIWNCLNEISQELINAEGRVYGGGLLKIEPRELNNVPADNMLSIIPDVILNQLKSIRASKHLIKSKLSDF